MQDETFEWDDVKAVTNWQDHGVTFDLARQAFKDILLLRPSMINWTQRKSDLFCWV
jgi:uncharacterized DUF497 family protein